MASTRKKPPKTKTNDHFPQLNSDAIACSDIGLWEWDLLEDELKIDAKCRQILRLDDKVRKIAGSSLKNYLRSENATEIELALKKYLAGFTKEFEVVCRIQDDEGKISWARMKGIKGEADEFGGPLGLAGTIIDVSDLMNAKEELERKNAQIVTICDLSGFAVTEISLPHLIPTYSDAFVRMLGYERGELEETNREWQSLCHPDDIEDIMQALDDYISGRAAEYSQKVRLRRKDGGYSWIRSNAKIIERNENGAPTRIFCTHFDMNEQMNTEERLRKALRENRAEAERMSGDAEKALFRQDSLLKAVSEVASLLMAASHGDFDRAITDSLSVLARTVGVGRVSVWRKSSNDHRRVCDRIFTVWEKSETTRDLAGAISLDFNEFLQEWWTKLPKGECINTTSAEMTDAEKLYFEGYDVDSLLVIPVMYRNDFWGFVSFTDNETNILHTEAELDIMKSAAFLVASSVVRHEAACNLILAKEAALDSAKAKNIFLANMSHEIRTPMNAIIGMTTIAQSANGDLVRVGDCLEKIRAASNHLLSIINDVLDMSRLESRKFTFEMEDFSFWDVMRSVYNMNISKVEDKHQNLLVRIDDRIPRMLVGDEMRLAQIINNLLSNAVKFTPRDGNIVLSASLEGLRENRADVVVSVSDTGIGIRPGMLDVIFNAFEQGDQEVARRFGGTGLGLAICKNFVEHMGGRIWAESEPGKGSKFSFAMSMKRAADSGLRKRARDETGDFDFSGKVLLLVEDIEINREIVHSFLEETGIVIDEAENGKIACEKFSDAPDRYDMIFMDIQMPVMDGYEATRKIRAIGSKQAKSVPIVAMTANAFDEDVERCKQAGMNDHMAKPVDLDALLSKMARYLNKKGSDPSCNTRG